MAAVIALLVVGLLNKGVDTGIREALAAGERPEAPDIALPVLAGGDGIGPVGSTLALSDLRGRTVILNVWASWCAPCQDEAPVLEGVARHYRERGEGSEAVIVIGVDVRDLSDKAREFVRRNALTYATVRDGEDGTERALQTTGVPETFVIDPEGRIAYRFPGPVERVEDLIAVVDQSRAS